MASALSVLLLLLVPGWLAAVQLVPPRAAREDRPAWSELAFAAFALGVLGTALAAHLLAVLGVFSLGALLASLALPCAALAVRCARSGRSLLPGSARGGLAHQLAPLVLVAGFAAVYLPPIQYLWGSADEGVYSNAALLVADTGALELEDDVLRGLPAAVREASCGSYCPGFYFRDGLRRGTVVPHGFHLLPAWLAGLRAVGGLDALFAGPVVLALLALAGLYFLAARFGGPLAGAAAALLLGLDPASVWFSRVTNAEGMTEAFLLAGFALAVLGLREERAEPPRLAAAGLLLGAVHLTKIEFVALPWAVLLWAVLLLATGRSARVAAALPAAYGAMLAWAALHGVTGHRVYLASQLVNPEMYGAWNAVGYVGAYASAALLAALAFARRDLVRALAERLPVRRALIPLGALAVLVAAYLYWGLPAQARLGELPAEELGALERALAVAPELAVGTDQRTWRETTFQQLGLYLSAAGVMLGVAGAFVLLRRRDCLPLAPFLCLVLAQTAFFLLVSGRIDYGSANPHAPGRRFVSITIPGLLLAGTLPFFAGRGRRVARAAGVLVCAWILRHELLASRALIAHRPWSRTVETVRAIAARGGPRTVWLAEDQDGLACRYAVPLRFLAGQRIFVLGPRATAAQADALLTSLAHLELEPVLLLGPPPPGVRSAAAARLEERLGILGAGTIPVPEDSIQYQRHRIPDERDFVRWGAELTYRGALTQP